jgi:hypothetical protein
MGSAPSESPITVKPESRMMYSPGPMENSGHAPDMERLESKVDELERLTDSLGNVPDEEVVDVLSHAVGLLREINAGIEAGLQYAREGSREMDEILARVNFGPFDEALEEIEEQERSAGEPGT